jgi:hypothetical protein
VGGNAMSSFGVVPIAANDIVKAICEMSKLAKIPFSSFVILGSAGKKPYSNDVDLAVDVNLFPKEAIHTRLVDILGSERAVFNNGTGVGSYAIPLNGHYVQVDLMFTPRLEWAKFAYFAPPITESRYKGAVRTMLLMGITSCIEQPGIDYCQYDDGILTIRIGRTFDLNTGIRRIYQYRPMRKDGTGFVKTLKTTSLKDIKQGFPHLESFVSDDEIVIDDPHQALELMFGFPVDPNNVNTAENVIELATNHFNANKLTQVFERTASRLKANRNNLELPPEISQYL